MSWFQILTFCILTLDGRKLEENIINLKQRRTSAQVVCLQMCCRINILLWHIVSSYGVCSQCIVAAAAGHQGCGYEHPSTINHSAAPFHTLTCATTLLIMSSLSEIQETIFYLLFSCELGVNVRCLCTSTFPIMVCVAELLSDIQLNIWQLKIFKCNSILWCNIATDMHIVMIVLLSLFAAWGIKQENDVSETYYFSKMTEIFSQTFFLFFYFFANPLLVVV